MTDSFLDQLTRQALADQPIDHADLRRVLDDPALELLDVVHAAFAVRRHHHGKTVQVHVLNNAQNGKCPEDCSYCAQARTSDADIEAYPIKSDQEILDEARRAYEAGAHRYCMVFAGRGPNESRTDKLADLVRQIKQRYPIEVCVSAGLLDQDKAAKLKAAGLDRYNHNLNTSRSNYPRICTTHTYDDRIDTLAAARGAGIETCSGVIVGMGETRDELVELASTLARYQSQSIPVNFLLPIEGIQLKPADPLTPQYCLRALCMFRFANPRSEVRCAAGREFHLRSLQVMCLYPANSLFLDGYLNGRGDARRKTYQMLCDAGFEIRSDHPLDELLGDIEADHHESESMADEVEVTIDGTPALKSGRELRPARA